MMSTTTSGMRCVLARDYGSAAGLEVQDKYELPLCGDSQVRIKVKSASMNPIDYKILAGDFKTVIKNSFPYVPGFDCSGVIDCVGKNVARYRVGDEVYADLGPTCGAFAEYALCDEANVSIKPHNLTFDEAAALPLCGLTAYQALHIHAKVQKGQKILILGGGGGVGHLAIQMAKLAGCNVTCTCGDTQLEFCKKLGADQLLDYKQSNWSTELKNQQYDVILDFVGGEDVWPSAQHVLAKGGKFVTTVGDQQNAKLTVGQLIEGTATVAGRKIMSNFGEQHGYQLMMTEVGKPEQLDIIRNMCETNSLKPYIQQTYQLNKDQVIAMFNASSQGHMMGKAVLQIQAPSTNLLGMTTPFKKEEYKQTNI